MPSPKSMKIILMYKPNHKANRCVSGSKRYVAYLDGGGNKRASLLQPPTKAKQTLSADSKAD